MSYCPVCPYALCQRKYRFWVSLATGKKVSKLQALSTRVSFSFSGACVAHVPEFVAKTESAVNPLSRSFIIKFLSDFAGGFDQELLLCAV